MEKQKAWATLLTEEEPAEETEEQEPMVGEVQVNMVSWGLGRDIFQQVQEFSVSDAEKCGLLRTKK